MILLAAILAAVLCYSEYKATFFNSKVQWNGFGSMKSVLDGKAQAPMQYRVLVPWLYLLVRRWHYVGYMIVKYVGMLLALLGFAIFCDTVMINPIIGMLFLAAILPITFLFDYADCYYELGLLSLSYALSMRYTADPHLLMLIALTFFATLNRETGIFIPLGYFILNGGIVGTIALGAMWLVAYLFPRMYYGKKGRYCKAIMLKDNYKHIRHHFSMYHIIYFLLMLWFAGAALFSPPFGFGSGLFILTLIFLAVLHVPSLWHEVRVFIPVLLYVIPATIKGLM